MVSVMDNISAEDWKIYTDDPAKMVGSVCAELERIQAVVKVHSEMEPFELIPVLMK